MADPIYPNASRPSVFAEAIEFQDFVCTQLAREHIILQNLSSKKYQYAVGENLQGFEIKMDLRCSDTGRLSIEIAEKSKASNAHFVPSGIYRDDNSWLYIQGNYSVLFVFGRAWLRRWHQGTRPKEEESYGTVRKFYLPLSTAREYALKVFDLPGVDTLTRPPLLHVVAPRVDALVQTPDAPLPGNGLLFML